jgi:hypothetical protein
LFGRLPDVTFGAVPCPALYIVRFRYTAAFPACARLNPPAYSLVTLLDAG